MSITDQTTGISVIYKNCSDLAYRLIYCEDSNFICMEPQTCIANCPNAPFPREKVGFVYVEQGQKKTYWSEIGLRFSGEDICGNSSET